MRSITCGLIAVLGLMLFANEAHARKGIIFYQSGDDIFESGPLPSEFSKYPKLKNAKAGYKCKIFGIFWAYLHIWDCDAVAFEGDTYYPVEGPLKEVLTKKYPPSSMKVGLWKKHGRWLYLLLIVGGIAFAIMGKKGGDDAEEDAEEPPPAES